LNQHNAGSCAVTLRAPLLFRAVGLGTGAGIKAVLLPLAVTGVASRTTGRSDVLEADLVRFFGILCVGQTLDKTQET